MSRERFPCGCVAVDQAWRELCPACRAEVDTFRAAHRDYIAAQRSTEETEKCELKDC